MTSEKNNVLFVDDEPKLLALVERMLSDFPLNIYTAICGKDALKLMATSPEMAVIVSNFHMGIMNGGDFLAEAKIQSPRSTRIIMTAGLGEDTLYEMTEKGLIHSFALKPLIVDHFISQIQIGIGQYLRKK
jgi:DNA-binding NtrC family response regulator